ncbi:NADH dehydrogenase [ubiquinone] 1 beta subcomplex subunit 2, mitochondrial-like [Oculina patagonica]
MGAISHLPRPRRIHVILSKFFGGTMVFWMLWRAKHDWPDLLGHKLLFELEDAEKAEGKGKGHH